MRNNFIFTHALDNLCQNALDLSNGKLIVESNWPVGTHCQWLISAVDDKHYVNLEFDFENFDVRIAESNYLPNLIHYLFIQITFWLNRLNIYDGPNEQCMKISEVYGYSKNKLLKSISSSGKSMFIDFQKQLDHFSALVEFEALIKYKKINFDCQTWLDNNNTNLMTPNHPNITNCSWLITSNYGSYIILNFTFIEVNSMILVNSLHNEETILYVNVIDFGMECITFTCNIFHYVFPLPIGYRKNVKKLPKASRTPMFNHFFLFSNELYSILT